MNPPVPSDQYKVWQKRRAEFQSGAKGHRGYAENRELMTAMMEEFSRAFQLSPDKGKTCQRLLYRFKGRTRRDPGRILDHCDCFRRGADYIVTSQPYGFDRAYLERWAAHVGAKATVADEWGFYYPGKANLIILAFTHQRRDEIMRLIARDKFPALEGLAK